MPEPTDRPPIAEASLSLVLLVPHEMTTAEAALRDWVSQLDTLAREYEILLTAESDSALSPEGLTAYPRVRVLAHAGAPGVGSALRTALKEARHPLVCYSEATGGYQPADLAKMLHLIDQVDLVTGFRPRSARNSVTTWSEYLFGLVTGLIFGIRLKDVDCAFRLMRRNILTRILIQSDGPFVHTEIMAKANFLGCLIAEVEVACEQPARTQSEASSLRQRRREAARVFRHPDFGPVKLPDEEPAPING